MKLNKNIAYALLAMLLIISCAKKEKQEIIIKEVTYNKKKKEEGKRYKKGIEYMAEYFKQISSKSLTSSESSYKPGYIFKELQKARLKSKNSLQKSSSPTAVFAERGPNNVPGRSRGIAIDPTDNRRWFVGSVGGGVWLTENEGSTWINLTDNQIPNLATSVIVISPQDKNTLYVGTGEPFGNLDAIGGSGIFKTTDGGATWINLTSTANFGDIGRMIIDPNNKNIVLAGTQTGIYRTTDGGSTWTRTHDSGGAWVQDLDADPSDFNIQYGSIRNVGVVKSIDGGLTWALAFDKDNFNASHQRFELDIASSDTNYVYLSVYSPSGGTETNTDFYVSKDKGATFTKLLSSNPGTANLVTGQGWYDNIIMVNPYDKNIFYIGGVAVFKVTVDESNNTYTHVSIASGYDNNQINTGVHVDQHGMDYILGNNQEFRILLTNDGGFYSTSFKTDPGTSQGDWSNDNLTKNSTQFYGATKQNGEDNYIAGAQDNGSWISTGSNANKTTNYQRISGGDGFEVLWHYNKPGDFISTIQFNRIVRYINNNGALSDFTSSGDNSTSPFYSKVSNADNNPDVVFAVDRNGVWRSIDFGGIWNQATISTNFAPSSTSALNVEVSVANPNVVWAGAAMTESGSFVLHYSTDNGQTFAAAGTYDNPNDSHNLFISGIGLSPTEEKRAYALFSSSGRPKVLKTEDMGQTWTDISGFEQGVKSGFPDVKVHCLIEMPFDKDILWVGTDIGLLETTDGGANWSLRTDMIPVSIYEMRIVNNQVVMATHGRGVWSATLSQLDNYTLPAYLTAPNVTLRQEGFSSTKAVVSYNATTSSVTRAKIFVDDVEKSEIIQNFDTGVTYQFETEDLGEGTHKIGVQLFDDNVSLSTGVREETIEIINFDNPTTSIAIAQFVDSDVYIYDNSFVINNATTLSNDVINTSDRPYQNNKEYSFVLRKPLTITANNGQLNYDDVAIVEPFDNPSSDLNSFYDFVTVEASKDLENWITLDKYDARRSPDWLQVYNDTFGFVTDNLFKTQSINLASKGLVNGETYVLRFRLVSDQNTTSRGWFVKSINATTASIREVLNNEKAVTIYPTISNGNLTIFAKNTLGDSKINIFDISGKEVYTTKKNFTNTNEQNLNLNLRPGVYFVNITDVNKNRISKKIIIK